MEKPKYIVDKKQLAERRETLEPIRVRLKKDFVGIDEIIDSLLDYIQIWYLMPEVLTRPIIVCLWGMTGVGKTDLVRRLVQYLDFQERFVEVELGNTDETTYFSSVSAILKSNGLVDDRPAIVLFDEIQRFYTMSLTDRPSRPPSSTTFGNCSPMAGWPKEKKRISTITFRTSCSTSGNATVGQRANPTLLKIR